MRWTLILLFLLASLAGCTDDEPRPADDTDDGGDGDAGGDGDGDGDGGDGDPGGDGDGDGDGGGNETPAVRDPVTWEVEVRDNTFSPASLDIQVGDTVKWVRIGTNPHTVTADDGSYHSGDCPGLDCFSPAGRQSYEVTFDTVGDSGYYCELHGSPGTGMAGTVSVLEIYEETP